jgi:hypothetical protein
MSMNIDQPMTKEIVATPQNPAKLAGHVFLELALYASTITGRIFIVLMIGNRC